MPRDAEFREAVDALVQEAFKVGKARGRRDTTALGVLGSRVLALYAERQGEVYGVGSMALHGPSGYRVILELPADQFKHGDRVRVVREAP